jgi:hypothetical protein
MANGSLSASEFQEVFVRIQRMNSATGLTWDCGGLGMIFFMIPFLAIAGIVAGVIDLIHYGTNSDRKIDREVKMRTEKSEKSIIAREAEIKNAVTNVNNYDEAIKLYEKSQGYNYSGDPVSDEFYLELANIIRYAKDPADNANQLQNLQETYLEKNLQRKAELVKIRPAVEKEFKRGVPAGWLKLGGGAVATVLTITCIGG